MPRDSSGNHTLPAGNPVVSGTAISSSVTNNTLNDISAALTDSLSRTGDGPMSAALELINGSAATPALSFDSDTDCGLWRKGADNIAMGVAGAEVLDIQTTGVDVTGALAVSTTLAVTGATTQTGALGCAAGVTVTQSTSNTNAVTATGNGTGTGGTFTGGAGGHGVVATGGTGNTGGVIATGAGDGAAITGSSTTGYGAHLTGNGSRAALYLTPQATAPTALDMGAIYMDTDGKLYVCNGAAWVVVGSQS